MHFLCDRFQPGLEASTLDLFRVCFKYALFGTFRPRRANRYSRLVPVFLFNGALYEASMIRSSSTSLFLGDLVLNPSGSS